MKTKEGWLHVPRVFDDISPEAVGEVGGGGLHSHVICLRVDMRLSLLEVVERGDV